ncbi:hypothetical protein [Actinokineospora terrae]|uniref:hypothetical protein n=1 Tax=Actinokineospora terrae TaxID=155974 RepID=UPI00116042FF|nr:hypothetical protein [Actinokineospora terrae]
MRQVATYDLGRTGYPLTPLVALGDDDADTPAPQESDMPSTAIHRRRRGGCLVPGYRTPGGRGLLR